MNSCYEYGGYFIEADLPSPLMGYPGALGLDLTWENFTVAMESAPFHIPMGGDIDFANGDRLGVTSLSLSTISLEHNPDTQYYELLTLSPIMNMSDVWATVGK